MTDTTNATMSHAAAMSAGSTNASSYPATCSRSGTATTTTAATTTAATTTSEQRPGRCDQQCRYCGYCKKLCHPRHDDLLFALTPRPAPGYTAGLGGG
ncbi:hypothetical protein [Bradyrhizobium sp. Ec3.3]|uniref:hypothetical protein n=1 Tax=Bradyrhizobium sp. Ec3.3 TaxID=189753 RepID=UPI0018DB0E54|nr:hypothetical protein [Bradyrhizobium sp. Ec3.3]